MTEAASSFTWCSYASQILLCTPEASASFTDGPSLVSVSTSVSPSFSCLCDFFLLKINTMVSHKVFHKLLALFFLKIWERVYLCYKAFLNQRLRISGDQQIKTHNRNQNSTVLDHLSAVKPYLFPSYVYWSHLARRWNKIRPFRWYFSYGLDNVITRSPSILSTASLQDADSKLKKNLRGLSVSPIECSRNRRIRGTFSRPKESIQNSVGALAFIM